MKLALGTVQFGTNYGVANTNGQMTRQEVSRVLSLALGAGIDTLDTAVAYGESEVVLGSLGVQAWKVITKLPSMPQSVTNADSWVNEQIEQSLSRLNVSRLYGLMLHRPMQLLGPQGKDLFESMVRLKSSGLVEKIGISVYSSDELESMFHRYSFDLVQAPLNIWDRRLVDSGWLRKLKRAGVEVHVRSVFLQGLLLMQSEDRPAKFSRWSKAWEVWDQWLLDTGRTPLEACLGYLNGLSAVDRVVVGVDSSTQLQQIILAAKGELTDLPELELSGDDRLLNPACWSDL